MEPIEPIRSILFPDNGGYTGFSIFVWEVYLNRNWGVIRLYVMEARYFIRGVLLDLNCFSNEDEVVVNSAVSHLEDKWKRKFQEEPK